MCSLSTCVMDYHSCLLYEIVSLHCIFNVMSAKQYWHWQLAEMFYQLTKSDEVRQNILFNERRYMTICEQLHLLIDSIAQLADDYEVWIFLAVGILAIFAKIILLMWLMLSNSVQYRRLFDSFRVYNTMTACLGFHKFK